MGNGRADKQKIAEVVQAMFNDKLRAKLELTQGITHEVLQRLGHDATAISMILSNKPAFKPLREVFNVTSNTVLQSGFPIMLGNIDIVEIPHLAFADASDDDDDIAESPKKASKASSNTASQEAEVRV